MLRPQRVVLFLLLMVLMGGLSYLFSDQVLLWASRFVTWMKLILSTSWHSLHRLARLLLQSPFGGWLLRYLQRLLWALPRHLIKLSFTRIALHIARYRYLPRLRSALWRWLEGTLVRLAQRRRRRRVQLIGVLLVWVVLQNRHYRVVRPPRWWQRPIEWLSGMIGVILLLFGVVLIVLLMFIEPHLARLFGGYLDILLQLRLVQENLVRLLGRRWFDQIDRVVLKLSSQDWFLRGFDLVEQRLSYGWRRLWRRRNTATPSRRPPYLHNSRER